jgi:filamentous hemagglutinin family protein
MGKGQIPPHPTLSPRERENQPAPLGLMMVLGQFHRWVRLNVGLMTFRSRRAGGLAAIAAMLWNTFDFRVCANPVRPVVTQGSATITTQGSQLTIRTSGNAFINWGSFNIAPGESTVFAQPSASSVVWNRINDPSPSQLLGRLDANGLVVLQNQSGFFVGGQAAINAPGLIMTTTPTPPPDIFSGGMWNFSAPPPSASIINYGQINAGPRGQVFLIANSIENHGTIAAPGGNIGLYAGKEVLISSRPDGRGLSAAVSLPQGSVDNSGKLIADAGTIAIHAQVVNQGGIVQANSVREQNGIIELVAGDALTLAPGSVTAAHGDAQTTSPGGSITLRSGNTFSDAAASIISVAGGGGGGAGGVVEVSAPAMSAINSIIDGHAAAGSAGGRLLIDPTDINLNTTGTGSAGSGTVVAGSPPGTLNLNVGFFDSVNNKEINSAFHGFSQIELQATHNITLADNTTWDLAQSTGIASPGSRLTLEAGNSINIGTSRGASIFAGAGWSVTLEAGRDFSVANMVVPGVPGSATAGTVTAGTSSLHNITLAGTGTVQAQDGSISALAGDNIVVNTGAIRTMNGGAIDAMAVSGSVNAGRNANAYVFSSAGYTVSGNLGGISTAAGGNVNISAGGDMTSFLPTTTSTSPTDAGSGAFGPKPGIVTVKAGGNVYGHFVAADSESGGNLVASTITANGGDAGASGNLLALSLVKGGWQVNAPSGSIHLQEVRNPNGVFNGKASAASAFKHLFDYDSRSFVDLEAGNAVYLEGTLLPRYTSDDVPIIYPPTLTLNAGAGGVVLGNNLTLFPSPVGELNLTTKGTLNGVGYALAMSDSGATSWSSSANFAFDHAAVPVQLNNPNPVVFDVSGNIQDITITTPKETRFTVKGEMDNTSFSGQNLHPGDVTSMNVSGRIFNQNVYSFITVGGAGLALPPARFPGDKPGYLQVLQDAVVRGSGPSSANGGLLFPNSSFFYLPGTKQIGYYGKMDSDTEQLLSGAFQVKTYTADGKAILDASGRYVTQTASLGLDPQLIQSLYTASLGAADPRNAPAGFKLGGPGQFNINAQSMDLGVAFGIVSQGPAGNPALTKVGMVGAALNIDLSGDLDMFSSQISSYYGGDITIHAGGALNVGFQNLPLADPSVAHGIWTSGHSDVNVVAGGNINVAGSRIAAFDGGNIHVTSLLGNVDAGSGGSVAVKVNEVLVDPVTFQVRTPQQPISGSGILATTLPDAPRSARVGDITVETPRGSINASQGGIVQEPLNGNTALSSTVILTAGTRNPDGTVLHPGDISAGESGVIGVNTALNAAGNISGLVIARGNSSINAAAAVTGTFLAGGTVNFSAVSISGIAIGGTGVNVGSGKFEGVALSQNVSGGGAQSALASSATASSTSQSAAAQQDNAQKAATSNPDSTSSDDEEKKRRAQRPLLAKYTGRVTVILPLGKK